MRSQRRRSLPLALLLACALLGAQWLGSWHRIAHAPGLGGAVAAVHQHDAQGAEGHGHDSHVGHVGHDGHDPGRGHERGSADCRLLDHLLGAAPITAALGSALTLAPPDCAPASAPGLTPRAAAWRQPAARGPPRVA